jgi:hypothetical protein
MLQVFLRGGLGNQLYQYSTGYELARAQGRELVLRGDLLPEFEDSIGGVSRWPNQLTDFAHSGRILSKANQPVGKTNVVGKWMQVMRLIGDQAPDLLLRLGWIANENSEPTDDIRERPVRLLNSYCSLKNLAFKNREILRHEINDIHSPSKDFQDLKSELKNSKAIAVHLRQGDYLNLGHIYGQSSLDFLKLAVQELNGPGELKAIWLFTDTPASVPKEVLSFLNPQKVIGPETLPRPIENLVLMSSASGLIAANSSFSWWASFLSSLGTPVCAPYILSARVNNFSMDSELDRNWRILLVP